MPFSVFAEGAITPNDAFFVRYHLAGLPYDLDPEKFTLKVKGEVDRELSLSITDLRQMPATEIIAVNQCSGTASWLKNWSPFKDDLSNSKAARSWPDARWRSPTRSSNKWGSLLQCVGPQLALTGGSLRRTNWAEIER
jgi:DMSO/TMAO reductase YedYZ molybdopterin-dependent catalytic subunit